MRKPITKKLGKRAGTCWCCGTRTDISLHHVIPRKLSHYKNLQIPLCRKHHDMVEEFWRKQNPKIVKCDKCGNKVPVIKKFEWKEEENG